MAHPINHNDMRHTNIKTLFKRYFIASSATMLVRALHSMADGIFIGNVVGANGLAAMNIILPLLCLFFGIAVLLGAGAGALSSIHIGEGKVDKARNIIYEAVVLCIALSVLFSIFILLFAEKICILLGADSTTLPYCVDYIRTMSYFFIPYCLTTTLNFFVRNDNAPKMSFIAITASVAANILMNYIFMVPLNMGMRGAALATGLAQFVSVGLLCIHFIRRKGNFDLRLNRVKFHFGEVRRFCGLGISNFIYEITFGIITLLFNRLLMTLAGPLGVSAFSIAMYVTNFFFCFLMGVTNAMQPIISYNYGAALYARVKETFYIGLKVDYIFAVAFTLLGMLFPRYVVMLFNRSDAALIELASFALLCVTPMLLPFAFNSSVSTLIQAIGDGKRAGIIALLRGFVFVLIALYVLSYFFGITGVCLAYTAAEVLGLIPCILSFKRLRKEALI